MTDNILVHITELTAMTLVYDKYNLFISIEVHYMGVTRVIHGVCHLLNRSNDELPVFILDLPDKHCRFISSVYGTCLKLIEFLGCLRIKILPVNKKDNLFNVRKCGKYLRRFE